MLLAWKAGGPRPRSIEDEAEELGALAAVWAITNMP